MYCPTCKNDAIKIAVCPLCAGDCEAVKMTDHHDKAYIRCDDCGLSTAPMDLKELLIYWNAR